MSHTVTGERIATVQRSMKVANLDALVLTPGPQMRYLTGLDAAPSIRFTGLIVPPKGQTTLIVPRFERPETDALVPGPSGTRIVDYSEEQDPYSLASRVIDTALGRRGIRLGLSNETAITHWRGLLTANPWLELNLASQVTTPLQMVKSGAELAQLTKAAETIDQVHAQMGEWLVPGRTEAQVADDISDALGAQPHAHTLGVSVASGENSARAQHRPSQRVIRHGDVAVVDVSAALPSGYRSECTRTYVLGDAPSGFADFYDAVREAQESAVAAIRPGVTAGAVDAAAKQHLRRTGHDRYVTHSTGHGVGLSAHEEPYLVAGDSTPLQPGMVLSVGPGVYIPGRFGARIEDVVVCADTGVQRLNAVPTSVSILR